MSNDAQAVSERIRDHDAKRDSATGRSGSPIRFCTVHLHATNVELTKDVGMVGYYFHAKYGFESSLVTYRADEEEAPRSTGSQIARYPFLKSQVPGLRLRFLRSHGRFLFLEIAVILFILRNARKIDILHLFGISMESAAYIVLYKILNPRGCAYLKADFSPFIGRHGKPRTWTNRSIRYRAEQLLRHIFLLSVDIVSAESPQATDFLSERSGRFRRKFICVRNGFDSIGITRSCIGRKGFAQKENLILLVGRVGSYQKNVELLLESLRSVALKDWRLALVGPVETGFHAYLEEYFAANSDMRDRVLIVGNIADRGELYDWYNRVKILCLPSRWEGAALVLPEALYFGNFIVATNVGSAVDITRGGTIGRVVASESATELSQVFDEVIKDETILEQNYLRAIEYAERNFDWSVIIGRLYDTMMKRRTKNGRRPDSHERLDANGSESEGCSPLPLVD